jgi:hypothetical protein
MWTFFMTIRSVVFWLTSDGLTPLPTESISPAAGASKTASGAGAPGSASEKTGAGELAGEQAVSKSVSTRMKRRELLVSLLSILCPPPKNGFALKTPTVIEKFL